MQKIGFLHQKFLKKFLKNLLKEKSHINIMKTYTCPRCGHTTDQKNN